VVTSRRIVSTTLHPLSTAAPAAPATIKTLGVTAAIAAPRSRF
jgi:hypothetical protein